MRAAFALCVIGAVVMAATIVYGFVAGEIRDTLGVIAREPWWHVTLIDLYLGFFLFAGWVAHRERSPVAAAIWIVLILCLGNLASCIYAARAARRADGDWRVFWSGEAG